MDYAFSPGVSKFDQLMRDVVGSRRPDGATKPTTKITATSGTLTSFLQDLRAGTPPRVERPIGHLVLVSHASAEGWLEMPLTDKIRNEINYESLIDAGTEIRIPVDILDEIDNKPKPTVVHIAGCRIGIARKFLSKFKDALYYADKVIAPKHDHFAGLWHENGKTVGRLEWLSYCFESNSTVPLKKKQQVVDLFIKDKHKYFDGSEVPLKRWSEWVPGKIEQGEKVSGFEVILPDRFGISLNQGDLSDGLIFDYKTQVSGPWEGFGRGPANGSEKAKRNFVRGKLSTMPIGKDTHEWPIWKRYLKQRYEPFDTLDDFVSGFVWNYEEEIKTWFGNRHQYRCIVPVTKPIGSKSFFGNFFPPEGPAHVLLDETDTRLYETV